MVVIQPWNRWGGGDPQEAGLPSVSLSRLLRGGAVRGIDVIAALQQRIASLTLLRPVPSRSGFSPEVSGSGLAVCLAPQNTVTLYNYTNTVVLGDFPRTAASLSLTSHLAAM